jgi:hypothetical protein
MTITQNILPETDQAVISRRKLSNRKFKTAVKGN